MLNLDSRVWWVVKTMLRSFHSLVRAAVPFVEVAEWIPGPVWMGVEKRKSLAQPEFRTQEHPARIE